MGFPLGEGWYGSVGGFWRISDGVRDPQFSADDGGQLTATLKHEVEQSELVTLYARYLDDKNQFITPIPVIQRGTDNFSAYPGFDPLTATYNSEAIQHVRLDGYPNGGTEADLAEGRGAQMLFVGRELRLRLRQLAGRSATGCWPTAAMSIPTRCSPAAIPRHSIDELYTIPTDLGGFALPAGSATATFVGGGAVAPEQSVIHQGWWFIHKELQSINNDFRLSKELSEGNTLTLGLYLAYYEMDDEWALGNQMFMTNEPNARPITVSYVDAGQTFLKTDEQGFLDNGGFNITQRGHAFNSAIYLSDSWRVNKWLLDASVRYENQDATNNVCNLTNVDLDAQSADALQQLRAGLQRNHGRHGLRRELHFVDGGRQLQLHGFHVGLCAREQRRAFPGFRQRHSWQHHGQYSARAGNSTTMKSGSSSKTNSSTPTSARTSATSPACCTNPPTRAARRWERGFPMDPNRRA